MRRTALLFLSIAACAGAPEAVPTPTPSETVAAPPCVPGPGSTALIAQNNTFDKTCLAAVADEAAVIVLDNKDEGQAHNVAIYTTDPHTDPAASLLFKGQLFAGVARKEYAVQALAEGIYHFHCDIHGQAMSGSYVVQAAT